MKSKRKVVLITFLIVIVIAATTYLILTDFGRKSIFSREPRKPKLELPVTYNIGWWPFQDSLKIDSIKVVVVESNLNLFNSKSLISYEVFGSLRNQKRSEPLIEKVHLSERFEFDSLNKCSGRIVEITPIVSTDENEEYKGQWKPFRFKNEHLITSADWGINKIKFVCGGQIQNVELRQDK